MGDLVSLTCPNCGGKLQVSSTIDRFACAYCGNEHIVKRGDGIIFLQPVVEGLQKVQSGVDKTASELAIKRLSQEIIALKAKRDETVGGWYGEYFGWRGFALVMFITMTFCSFTNSWSDTTLFGKLLMIFSPLVTLVSVVVIYKGFMKQKVIEEKKWKKFDGVINSKLEELDYHKDIVSRA